MGGKSERANLEKRVRWIIINVDAEKKPSSSSDQVAYVNFSQNSSEPFKLECDISSFVFWIVFSDSIMENILEKRTECKETRYILCQTLGKLSSGCVHDNMEKSLNLKTA